MQQYSKSMEERQIHRGSREPYYWLTSTEDYGGTLLQTCPEIVIGRYVAITSTDSGILELTDSQTVAGWQNRGDIAYSPKICSIAEIPHQGAGPDVPGYDEFYVFDTPRALGERVQGNFFEEQFTPAPGRVVVFANWPAFVLSDPDPTVQSIVSLFWKQLERLQPESYIADGRDCLTFASRNQDFVDRLHEKLARRPLNP